VIAQPVTVFPSALKSAIAFESDAESLPLTLLDIPEFFHHFVSSVPVEIPPMEV